MDLKDFIKDSFVQIAKGIEEANEELKDSSAQINPDNVYVNAGDRQNYGRLSTSKKHGKIVEVVEFDVAVIATGDTESGGKLGVKVGVFEIGANGNEKSGNKAESRIKFRIPAVFPSAK